MSDTTEKRRHNLHACRTSRAFERAFEQLVGQSVEQFLRHDLHFDVPIRAALLVGSIPLGIATDSSDIDIMLLVERSPALRIPKRHEAHGVMFSGAQKAADDSLLLGNVVAMANHVEVDVVVVAFEALRVLAEDVVAGGVALTTQQIRLLGRALSGWVLTEPRDLDPALNRLKETRALEIFCVLHYLVAAWKHLEKAQAALPDRPGLASHLAREAVEAAFASLLASRGDVAPGFKWPARLEQEGYTTLDPSLTTVRGNGLELLFPKDALSLTGARSYIADVEMLVQRVTRALKQDSVLHISIQACPQLSPTAQIRRERARGVPGWSATGNG